MLFCIFSAINAQEKKTDSDSLRTNLKEKGIVVDGKIEKKDVNPLAPSRAAFYSAILPGLGQIYNRRYWKVPIVYGALGTGVYAYLYNDDLYDRFRSAFKRRRAGFTDDEFYDVNSSGIVPGSPDLSDEALQDAQERYQRDRDLALLITIGLYAFNIIDANVDAHLQQFNVDDDLSLDIKPYLEYHPITSDPNYGLALTIKF
ncbi:MAG: hypothetical protein HKO75_08920 [Flavobacteriaceae bacterium]|nr:hypothetical protein [Muriicola sp.]NNC61037.1 hypothetical protein [Eudoraea sp.]NNK21423.1 hypothetical protein [Flavobacteriaceae bacterium]MBT8289352.1 hypothetical protein [Muriicola sp.]NNK34544.1 hypothetical protein [Eudoraea sp.]